MSGSRLQIGLENRLENQVWLRRLPWRTYERMIAKTVRID